MSTVTVTTEQVHELIEQLAAMTAAASITPQMVANIFENMRQLNDQEREKVIAVAEAYIEEIQNTGISAEKVFLDDGRSLDSFVSGLENNASILITSKEISAGTTIFTSEDIGTTRNLYFDMDIPASGALALYTTSDTRIEKIQKTDGKIKGQYYLPDNFGYAKIVDGKAFINYIGIINSNADLGKKLEACFFVSDNTAFNTAFTEIYFPNGNATSVVDIETYKAFAASGGRYLNGINYKLSDNTYVSNIDTYYSEADALAHLSVINIKSAVEFVVDWAKVPSGMQHNYLNVNAKCNNLDLQPILKAVHGSSDITALQNRMTTAEGELAVLDGVDIKVQALIDEGISLKVYGVAEGAQCNRTGRRAAITGRYAFIPNGGIIDKWDIGIETAPEKLGYQTLDSMSHSVDVANGYVYATSRVSAGGATEPNKPLLRIMYEAAVPSFYTQQFYCNNAKLTALIKKWYFGSFRYCDIAKIDVAKGVQSAGTTKYISYMSVTLVNGYSFNIYSSGRKDTQADAIANLPSSVTFLQGNFSEEIELDWSALDTGERVNVTSGLTVSSCGEFDSYTNSNGASISEVEKTAYTMPSRYCYQAKLLSGSNSGSKSALAIRALPDTYTSIQASIWFEVKAIDADVNIPILGSNNSAALTINLRKSGTKVLVGLNGTYGSTEFDMDTAYQLKVIASTSASKISWRDKEGVTWAQVASTSGITSVNQAMTGISTTGENVSVLVDDLYIHNGDIDTVSCVLGQVTVFDVDTFTKVKTLHLDFKAVSTKCYKNHLYVCMLNGYNVYDISTPQSPVLVWAQRGSSYKEFGKRSTGGHDANNWVEYQDVQFYSRNNHDYAVFANYLVGISVWDITDPADITLVGNNVGVNDYLYNFNIEVIYPYVYGTCSVVNPQIGTSEDKRGIFTYDISDLTDISVELAEYPDGKASSGSGTADEPPIHIARHGGYLLMENGEYGVSVWAIGSEGQPTFIRNDKIIEGELSEINKISSCLDSRYLVSEYGGNSYIVRI